MEIKEKKTMNFMIGCNYWDSKSGTNMWRNWDFIHSA